MSMEIIQEKAQKGKTAPYFLPTLAISEPLIDLLREGFGGGTIDGVSSLAGLTRKEIATLLGVSERQLYNINKTDKFLNVLQSEHLLKLQNLFLHGLQIFDGNAGALSTFLRSPHQALAVPETGFPAHIPEWAGME